MAEDAACLALHAEGGECCGDGECDGGHGYKLKEACEDGSHEVSRRVHPLHAEQSEARAHNQCAKPQPEVLPSAAASVFCFCFFHYNL